MSAMFLLFNHSITPLQEEDACRSLHVGRIVESPPVVKAIWSQIPADLSTLSTYLDPVRQWLLREAAGGDFILIQGDFGATFLMVEFARQNALVPLYSTTERTAVENHLEDGSVQLEHHFRHIRYRRYGR